MKDCLNANISKVALTQLVLHALTGKLVDFLKHGYPNLLLLSLSSWIQGQRMSNIRHRGRHPSLEWLGCIRRSSTYPWVVKWLVQIFSYKGMDPIFVSLVNARQRRLQRSYVYPSTEPSPVMRKDNTHPIWYQWSFSGNITDGRPSFILSDIILWHRRGW